MKTSTIRIFLLALVLFAGVGIVQARRINVHGRVTSSQTGEPIGGVCIFNGDTNVLVGSTNNEGKYMVSIDDEGELIFEVLGSKDEHVVVNGRLNIDVALQPDAMALEELVVEGARVTSAIVTEPTDLDVKGNYLHIKTRVKMPREMFNSSSRLIIQPMVNNVTHYETSYLSPIVYDGWRYAYTQERMLDFDRSKDPLTPYVQVKSNPRSEDNVITIIDSVYVENPNDDFLCDLMLSLENYNRIIYGDTVTIARGVVNPLRFLELNMAPFYVSDADYLPTPDLQLRDARGDIKLTFRVGQGLLDLDLANNRAELESLMSEIREIESDPNARLKSFEITGTASPEGRYNYNLNLANRRMRSAMQMVLDRLEASTRRTAEFETNAEVEEWSTVVNMLMADGKTEQAQAIEEIIATYPGNHDLQFNRIVRLPFYTDIKNTYLPQLRRVSYQFVSSRYRYLTDDEIADLYRTNPSNLSRFEYWRLYSLTDDLGQKEAIAQQALQTDSTFLVAATDLSTMWMQRGVYDPSLLEPLLNAAGDNVPDESRAVLARIYLNKGNYLAADSLVSMLPDDERFHKTITYAKALNGKYLEVMQEVSSESPFNEVLMLLAVKADEQAWERAQLLGTSAREEYVKAIAANRVDDYIAAKTHLDNAFRLDPSLRQVAKVDGDVIDLLEQENEY